jgi:hypothetical protein
MIDLCEAPISHDEAEARGLLHTVLLKPFVFMFSETWRPLSGSVSSAPLHQSGAINALSLSATPQNR